MKEQTEPSSKKVRGRSKNTIKLIEAMHKITEEAHPITGQGIGYKLLAQGLISGMNVRGRSKVNLASKRSARRNARSARHRQFAIPQQAAA